ncbi:class I SAM-dependent methyltransferase [Noviherbaspirillum galbum]|uniref:Class I SAM-dependent methyltransferase n=1 Tax=Noviherbaspirillum galbum TaxID=2709383 RepID=A0A6B3SFI6_9BURK|nr:class I SAM-dependent methyltransferase [Noviherbaspirillum galbum]NEX59657.1 class I SAM-dependent methyltransferase [Noviherbaspirillum galbum]
MKSVEQLLSQEAGVQRLGLNELPRYSAWPQRLLEAEEAVRYFKSKDEIYREYEKEKWSSLLAAIETRDAGLDEIEGLQYPSAKPIAVSAGDGLFLAPPLVVRQALATLIGDRLAQECDGAAGIAELGAGTGGLVARMARDPRFGGMRFYAGDFSPSSVRIIDYLARRERLDIASGLFDFNDVSASPLAIPENAVLFSSFAIAYAQALDYRFWEALALRRPASMLLFEPIVEHYRPDSLLGLMRKRYYEFNDYSRRILGSLQEAEERGLLRIEAVEENLLGVNPLCPVSMIRARFHR